MRLAVLGSLMLVAGPAEAHGPEVTPANLWHSWTFDPLTLVPLLLVIVFYAHGVRRLWMKAGRARGVTIANVLAFALGIATLVIALVSPLDPLGETLLSAHMAQHGLLVAVAPLLLLLGKPGVAFTWAMAPRFRKQFFATPAWRAFSRFANTLSRPLPAAALHGVALWAWHAPAAFDAAAANYGVHVFEHLSFFVTAILFWRAILTARAERHVGAALGASFATLMHGGLLGGLITMAPYPMYKWYLHHSQPWGFTPIEDQQLAGLVMWVPMGFLYFAACLMLASRLVISRESVSRST